ncbi:hypothetical protein CI109_101107 [Kwoniella shandongensis]|uniref:Uncharacterized protein n=1 Tax=Kwoniella shandongensis TaxID=1734106 RepID=A0A5M6C5V6_9TREE|nr:uncharacterized protein CI109_001577 [Kwoniella shandongensis]KAA5530171.1 hypothetical protein CI109_001577 [Kwoniella shandongensis]
MLAVPFTHHRLSKIWLMALLLLLSLFVLFAPFTSHGEGTRQALKVVYEKVKTKAGGVGGTSKGSVEAEKEWDEEDAMREWELRRALQHEGTGARIQAFLDKARSGQPFTVSVIGGSVSKGRGLTPPLTTSLLSRRQTSQSGTKAKRSNYDDDDQALADNSVEGNVDITEALPDDSAISSSLPDDSISHPIAPLAHLGATTLYSPDNLHVMIFDWLNEQFPHPDNRFVNGAQGGVGAGYFGWCFKEHIPEDSDLILLELGINDLLEPEVVSSYEHLLRGLLELDSKPAIINIETFTTLFPSLLSSSTFHQDVLSFYDVPSVAIRDVLVPRLLADPERQMPRWFRTGEDVAMGDPKVREYGGIAVDVMHISAIGHALTAGLVIRYLQDQLDMSEPVTSKVSKHISGHRPTLRVLEVPATSLTGQFNPFEPDAKHAPVCRSENSAKVHGTVSSLVDDFESGEVKGLPLAEGSHGWSKWAWKEKRYLIAREPGAIALFDFVISEPIEVSAIETNDDSAIIADIVNVEESLEDPELEAGEDEEEDGEVVEESRTGRGARFSPPPLAMRPGGPYNQAADSRESTPRSRRRKTSSPRQRSRPQALDQQTRARRWLSGPNQPRSRKADGSVLIGYQRSAKLGLGSVWCWVDDKRMQGTQVDGWWKLDKRNMGMVKEVASGLETGKHTLHCELLQQTLDPGGGTEFRLFAVMHD